MPSYRFCRPDDIPFLVRSINECYLAHFPGLAEMTVERFRDEMKGIDLWPSNSMIAVSGDDPLGVLIGTKRADAVRILRIGIRPQDQRQGHSLHMITSLGQKLAVLGPERLVAEVPAGFPGAAELLTAAGYWQETHYTDFVRPPAPAEPVPKGWLLPITVDELDALDLLPSADLAWERSAATLRNRTEELAGFAIASDRVEAYALVAPAALDDPGVSQGRSPRLPEGSADVLALAGQESEQRDAFYGILLRHLAATTPGALRLPKLAKSEVPRSVLDAAGFQPGERWDRWAGRAIPA